MRWHPFQPAKCDYEFNDAELSDHRIDRYEAAEVFWNGITVRRNKGYSNRYQITGVTDAGRHLMLIVERVGNNIRVITGWPT